MKCVKILSYTIPFHGNKRHFPYGKMLAEKDGVQKEVFFGDCDGLGMYIIFNRRRYYYTNKGNLYNPVFVFTNEEAVG